MRYFNIRHHLNELNDLFTLSESRVSRKYRIDNKLRWSISELGVSTGNDAVSISEHTASEFQKQLNHELKN